MSEWVQTKASRSSFVDEPWMPGRCHTGLLRGWLGRTSQVYSGNRPGLGPEGESAVVVASVGEKRDDGSDAVGVGDFEKTVDPLFEAFFVGVPQPFVQIDAHGVETQLFRHAEFLVDELRVECFRLPEFVLVDGVGRDVVASYRPVVGFHPRPCLFTGPLSPGGVCCRTFRFGCVADKHGSQNHP